MHTQAAKGHAWAQYNLGDIYESGKGVPQDYATARQWYEKLAVQDIAKAQGSLGNRYARGNGVPQDYATAQQWYEKAAAQGNAMAQINLGKLYLDGQGVPQNGVRAYMWFNLAAENSKGDLQKMSADNRDEVARRMTSAQIAEATKLVREWKPRTP